MSEYLRVLKRIEHEEAAQPRRTAARVRLPVLPERVTARAADGARRAPRVAAACATLFDNLRAAGNGRAPQTLVFTAASSVEAVLPLVDALAAHAAQLGCRLVVLEIAEAAGCSVLRHRPARSGAIAAADSPALELHSAGWSREAMTWLDGVSSAADMVLIAARPLAGSIDAAFIGRECDGLVLVAQPEATPMEDLRAAAERTRAVGCRALGVVLTETRDHMPHWLRRLLGPGARPVHMQGA